MGDIASKTGRAYDEDVCILPLSGGSRRERPDLPATPHLQTRSHAMSHVAHLHLSPDAIYPFDARGIAKRFRHAAIFGALDALQSGETMRFTNDHDPLPLLQQLTARYGDAVTIRYLQRDPGAILIDFVKN
jgi:uncharacterized protein (DUF2249 family)